MSRLPRRVRPSWLRAGVPRSAARAGVIVASALVVALTAREIVVREKAAAIVYRLAIVSDGTPLAIPIGVTSPQGGRVPMSSMRLGVAIDPAPAATPDVAWSTTGGASVTRDLQYGSTGTPAPGEVFFVRGSALGPLTVTARVGPPVNRSITVPAFAYARADVECRLTVRDAVAYDRRGEPREVDTPGAADVFMTGPDSVHRGVLEGCDGPFARNDEPMTLHVPGGAVAFSTLHRRFSSLTARDFAPPLRTSFREDALPGEILFRLRNGRLAKTAYADAPGDRDAGSVAAGPILSVDRVRRGVPVVLR